MALAVQHVLQPARTDGRDGGRVYLHSDVRRGENIDCDAAVYLLEYVCFCFSFDDTLINSLYDHSFFSENEERMPPLHTKF